MKKSLTLVELILSMVLLSTIIFAATAIDLAARGFFRSSDERSRVQNEASLVLEHIQQNASRAHGWNQNPGFNINANQLRVRLDGGSPETFGDALDSWVQYQRAGNQLILTGAGPATTLSQRVTNLVFAPNPT